jgi:hypothetical protein
MRRDGGAAVNSLRRLASRVWFRWLMRRNRFAEALALCDPSDPATDPERRFALYRLGCYRSAVRDAGKPRTARELVALAVSVAAIGDQQRAAAWLSSQLGNRLKGPLLVEVVRAIAPYDLASALRLAARAPGNTALKAALLIACGQEAEAKLLLHDAYIDDAAEHPDAVLLRANLTPEPAAKLAFLNAYFARHDLSPLALKDPTFPPSPTNVRGSLPLRAVKGPLVTVIVPAYQTAGRIAASLGSLLAQTYRSLEILVVDDASDDGTMAEANAVAAHDSRVRILCLAQNGGPYVARNRALAEATGEFITVHDSDDFAHPEKIARQATPLAADARLLLTTSDWVRVSDEGEFYARSIFPLSRLNPASPMFRRETALAQVGRWEEVRTGADSAYTARLRLFAGARGECRLRQTLTLGAHRDGSLMTAPETGIARGSVNDARLDYWERWTDRHIRQIHQNRQLYKFLHQRLH